MILAARDTRVIARLMLSCASIGLMACTPRENSAAEHDEVTVERSVAVKMRDGVTLRAQVFHPRGAGRFPVLLARTPYNRSSLTEFSLKAAARGYVVAVQDVRGRYASEGEWYPFMHEASDGYDTVEWAAALPWSNGKVGMFGGSYVGATQFLAAIADPPHLAGLCPNDTASDYHDGWTYHGGAFEQWFGESWTTALSDNTLSRRVAAANDLKRWTQILPLRSYPVLGAPSAAALAPYFSDWLAHPTNDEYWKRWSIAGHSSRIRVPVLNLGGWYDIFLGGALSNYQRLKKEAGTAAARSGQRLLLYVAGHAGGLDWRQVGAVDFGKQLPLDLGEVTLRWYDHLFKGLANGVDHEKPVKIFVMGVNTWREEDDWPLPRAQVAPFYLHSTGAARGSEGGGALGTDAPAQERPDQYDYDPANAVPTIGGALCCEPLPTGIGPQDQRPAETRADVLVFSSPALTERTEVTGPVVLDLYVSSSAVDTDFTGKLVDVWPNGFAQNLTEGILRLRYRRSQEKPELGTPHEIYLIRIDLGATSNVFLPRHRLRLEVSSSNFPRFDRNLNTGEDQSRGIRMVKATNVIYHDRSHPSALILPLVP
jgi:putative CocE/NonD family hydrolase